MKAKVAVLNANYFNIDKKIEKIIKLADYEPEKKNIFIKPNIVGNYKPSSGIITHPNIVEAVIKFFKKNYPDINLSICEGSAVHADLSSLLKKTGYAKLIKKYNIKIIDLNKIERKKIKWKNGTIMMPKILDTHEYINIAVIKTHIQTIVSLCIKNLKGLLKPADKKAFHNSNLLDKNIYDYSSILNPALNILSGITALDKDGPMEYGTKRKDNFILASKNLFAVDNAALKIMSISKEKVKHIPKYENYEIIGDKIRIRPFKLPGIYFKKFNVYVHPYNSCSYCPVVLQDALLPKLSSLFFIKKLFKSGLFNRKDIVLGDGPYPENAENVLCIGKCSKKFAEKYKLPYIEGCPPTIKKIRDEYLKK